MLMKDYLQKEDNFIKLYKFTCSLPKEQSYMLSYLIDAESFITRKMPGDNNYFMCDKQGFINNLLTGWSVHEITAAIKGLEKAGYVTSISKNEGFERHTYIKLNYEALINLITEYKKLEIRSYKNLDSGLINTEDNKELNKKLYKELYINNADKSADQNKDSLNNKSLNKNTLNDLNNISPNVDFNEKELNNITSAREAGGGAAESVPVDEADENSKRFDKIVKNGIYAYDYETLLDIDSDLAKLVRNKLIEYFKLFRGRLNVKQVKGQIESLLKDNNYSVDYVIKSIDNSYTKNYKGFYSVVPNNKPKSTMVPMSERPGNKNVTQGVSVERSKLTPAQFKVFKGKGEN